MALPQRNLVRLTLFMDDGDNASLQAIYRFSGGHGISLSNSQHGLPRPAAWSAMSLRNVSRDGTRYDFAPDCDLMDEVRTFDDGEGASQFIADARVYFARL